MSIKETELYKDCKFYNKVAWELVETENISYTEALKIIQIRQISKISEYL